MQNTCRIHAETALPAGALKPLSGRQGLALSACRMEPADGDRNAELSNANKSFADHRVTLIIGPQVQEEEPLQLKYSSPPTIINHILLNIGPVSAFWASSAMS